MLATRQLAIKLASPLKARTNLKEFEEIVDGEVGLEAIHTVLWQLMLFFALGAGDSVGLAWLRQEIPEATFAVSVQAGKDFGRFVPRQADRARQFFVNVFS